MALTDRDLNAIGRLIDSRLDSRLEAKLEPFRRAIDKRFNEAAAQNAAATGGLMFQLDAKFETFGAEMNGRFDQVMTHIDGPTKQARLETKRTLSLTHG